MSVRISPHFTAVAVITALLTGALAGCGSPGSKAPSAAPTAAASGAGSTTPACPAGMTAAGSQGACAPVETTAPPTTLTAAQITQKLKDAGLPISKVIVYTEKTDPNNMMGRPGGYVGKTAFVDKRVDPAKAKDDSEGSAELGGSVEVYSISDAAAQRAAYVQGFYTGGMLGSEYDYSAGSVVLRVSGILTPSQARGYQDALNQIVGTPAQPAPTTS
jgi:hypothetical protein